MAAAVPQVDSAQPPANLEKAPYLYLDDTTWSTKDTEVEQLDLTATAGSQKFACVLHHVLTERECDALIARAEARTGEAGYKTALINAGGGEERQMLNLRNNDRALIDDAVLAEEMWQRVLEVMRYHCDTRGRAAEEEGEKTKQTNHPTSTTSRPRFSFAGIFGRSTPVPAPAPVPDVPGLMADLLCNTAGAQPLYAVGLNERLRFLRYDPGNYFAPHFDGTFTRGRDVGELRQFERSYVTFQLYLNGGFEGGATRFLNGYDRSVGIDVVPRTGSVLLFEHAVLHEGSLLVSGRKYTLRTDVMYNQVQGVEYSLKPFVMPRTSVGKGGGEEGEEGEGSDESDDERGEGGGGSGSGQGSGAGGRDRRANMICVGEPHGEPS
mmetsp:Transcript_29748/g.69033  ORF Transcript_29748/g.69033 Transcript_29748/m.69033 type:complete len:380 (-) Transcript_29748:344-1483(-)|eukprot:CAMPEP_0182556050 /NCGR_PEP_ID=MMETSP1324-20130603/439_1 /TAXON_ID=236786 /ORGANISM="Florenciella sp., Strain RCC1587" /LENGTH=379 /DNA_ID=CAMNT_0024767875 /DNA_START=96 /DNA_END=1235 /DNA_ORIENTATION=+